MYKAYDTFLQSEVYAELAAKSHEYAPYRYECAHCGEDVFLAAVKSKYMVPHFRHHSGNNDVECENYLGLYGAISTDPQSRKSKNERAEFYFDSNKKMFFLGLRFSDYEITFYEQNETNIELWTSINERALSPLQINNKNFYPDELIPIFIEKFSYSYFLSNTFNNIKRKYDVFKSNNNTPTFFKIQGNDDNNYKAKLVRSEFLYTDIPYFAVFQGQFSTQWSISLPNDMQIEENFNFETMSIKFMGYRLTIKNKTTKTDALVSSWGYKLEVSETLALLWPPAFMIDDVTSIESDYAYLYSSFELQAYGNINICNSDIKKILNNVSRISIESRIKIHKKNIEMVIDKNERNNIIPNILPITEKFESIYSVQDNNQYFLFNRSGVMEMSKGQSIYLTPASIIRCYRYRYLYSCIYYKEKNELTDEELLKDILAHYKRTEVFNKKSLNSLKLSDTALQYLISCEASGYINSAVKRFIEEGWL